MRAEEARLAAVYADRYIQARAAASYRAMLHWAGGYRRCAARCRRLGKRIRGEVSGSPAAVASAIRPSSRSPGDTAPMLPRPGKRPETMCPGSPDIDRQTPPPLHELEQRVMEEIWRRGEVSVRGVMEALNGRSAKDRAYTTYMTIMARLDGKGLLKT